MTQWDLMRELASMQDRMNRIWGNVYERGREEVSGAGAWLPFRSDSLLGLVRPAPSVLRSSAFPTMFDSFRLLERRPRVGT